MPNADFAAIMAVCAKDNAGGLGQTVYVAPEGNVDAIGAATAKEVATITMATGKVFTALSTSNVTSKRTWALEAQGDADSGGYKVTAEYFIPKVTSARVNALDGPCSIIAVCPDNNGNKRLVGNKTSPASMKYAESIQEGTNGMTITIEWETGQIPDFYTGTVAV